MAVTIEDLNDVTLFASGDITICTYLTDMLGLIQHTPMLSSLDEESFITHVIAEESPRQGHNLVIIDFYRVTAEFITDLRLMEMAPRCSEMV